MWTEGWREKIWSILDTPWDMVIIGGGITGAGILCAATRAGLKALLVEADDFASGTSSRSSKLVHGGFRYLKNGQIKTTIESVRERERLLREGKGLINQLGFLIISHERDRLPPWLYGLGLTIYDLLALQWQHRYYEAPKLKALCPQLSGARIRCGYRYIDAFTDDARLVLRVLRQAVAEGGTALNYARVVELIRDRRGFVRGVAIQDHAEPNGKSCEIQADMVVNATGVWADEIRFMKCSMSDLPDQYKFRHLRRLRGSHLILPYERLPLNRAISFLHPVDSRPVFAFPWEGVTLFGTTDVDHNAPAQTDPWASDAERNYLLNALQFVFPELDLDFEDIQATFSGIRGVLDTGKRDPSKESREHVLWYENGLLTITGGKLTTFRLMAKAVIDFFRKRSPDKIKPLPDQAILSPPGELPPESRGLPPSVLLRLSGRYGFEAGKLLSASNQSELLPISNLPALWAELRWAARSEGVVHLDDLLLRRVRIGLTLPRGGLAILERIKHIVQTELNWSEERWRQEAEAYSSLWQACYSP